MIAFENYLIDKGYIKFQFDANEMKYKKAKKHIISTMVNLGYSYIHNTDVNLLNKIEQGKSVLDKDFTWEDRKNEIVVGLHETKKPVTLINPRPRILIEKIVDDEVIRMSEYEDDSMNIILQKFSFDEIFEAMYDKEKILYYKIN